MRLDRPIGSLLLLWPTLWALWIAGAGHPDSKVVGVFVAGVFLMRSAGCVINDYADRHVEPHETRTRARPLAAGRVMLRGVLWLFAVLCLAAFTLVLTMNMLTILMSFGAVALAALYPFMKRYTHLPQVVLGMAFGWSIPMAFAAETGSVPPLAWLLFVANVLWTTAYDTMYGMVARDDDIRIGVKSTAVQFGDADRVLIALLQGMALIALVLIGKQAGLGIYYHAGLATTTTQALYQLYLIRHRVGAACFKAFLNNNWFGAAVFAGLALDYAMAA